MRRVEIFPIFYIVVVDFGIARQHGQKGLTKTSHVKGTARYMAPEYIRNRIVSPAMDVYQMALILVEVLTGYPVVQDDDAIQCMYRHAEGNLQVPDSLTHGVLGPILKCALAVNPTDRYQTGDQFADALEHIDASQIQVT